MNPKERNIEFEVGSGRLHLEDVIRIARNPRARITLSDSARMRMKSSRDWVETQIRDSDVSIYGVNTGFGSKASIRIGVKDLEELQRNLVMSHSAGVGRPFDVDVVRAAMVLLACSLARGHSGARPLLVETLIAMLNAGVVPRIPEKGSLGASGDLAPLAHLALSLSYDRGSGSETQEAFVYRPESNRWDVQRLPEALRASEIDPVRLQAKEGLALINGTHFSAALACLALSEGINLAKAADITAAASLEALKGQPSAFDPRLQTIRPHPGQEATALNIRTLTQGSGLMGSMEGKVQDAYSLRCIPQVHGCVKDWIRAIRSTLDIELNSVTDNPVIFLGESSEGEALSGGNFHAEPLALACDFLAVSMAELGSISERRLNRMMDRKLSEGLPSFLTHKDGLESGLMMGQYTAASLVSENKALSHPASVDSIPVSEEQEDHVSMAPISGRKARLIAENVAQILAIELLCACQALDLRREFSEGKPGRGIEIAYSALRERVEPLKGDREISSDMRGAFELLSSGQLVTSVEEGLGKELLLTIEEENQ
jgi:histidine ammonia-lyase